MFQSTRPRGARLGKTLGPGSAYVFQSTCPRGARHAAKYRPDGYPRFQSTRPRGARLGRFNYGEESLRFNPRARAGRDCIASI